MKKRMIAGLMAVLMTMSLAACGSSAGSSDASGTGSAATGDNSAAQAASGDKVTLSLCWWGNQTRNDVTKKACLLYTSDAADDTPCVDLGGRRIS